jgi:hypothetical protein
MGLKIVKTNKMQIVKKQPNITTLFPHGESEPFVVKILPSGWQFRYHVISEWGDSGETTHKLMKVIDLIEFYNLDANDLPSKEIYCLDKTEILNYPNDSDLGEFIRKKLYE